MSAKKTRQLGPATSPVNIPSPRLGDVVLVGAVEARIVGIRRQDGQTKYNLVDTQDLSIVDAGRQHYPILRSEGVNTFYAPGSKLCLRLKSDWPSPLAGDASAYLDRIAHRTIEIVGVHLASKDDVYYVLGLPDEPGSQLEGYRFAESSVRKLLTFPPAKLSPEDLNRVDF